MFENYTEEARETLELTAEEAKALGHAYLGVEHILLGLLAQKRGIAVQALASLGVTTELAREHLVRIVPAKEPQEPNEETGWELPFTPRARRVLEFAVSDSVKLGSLSVGPEHILLAVAREGNSLATLILRQLGADARRVTAAVISLVPVPTTRPQRAPLVKLESTDVRIEPSGHVGRVLTAAAERGAGAGGRALELADLMVALVRDAVAGPLLAECGINEAALARMTPAEAVGRMFERFNLAAREVLVQAGAQAERMRHRYIGTEHLLLSLMADADSLAARALAALDLTGARAQARLLLIVGPGDGAPSEQLRLAPRAKHVLEVAGRLTSSDVTPEVLLTALVREGGVAIRILTELDAPPERVEDMLWRLLPTVPRLATRPLDVRPEPTVYALLMKAAARALSDNRIESRVGDLLAAVAGDATATAWLADRGVDVAAMRAVIDARVRPTGRIRPAPKSDPGAAAG